MHRSKIFIRYDSVLIFKFAIPLLLSNLTITPAFFFIRTLLVVSSGFSNLGFFQIADTISSLILFASYAIAVPFIPMISEQYERNPQIVSQITSKVLRIVLIISLPVALIFGIYSRPIISILFGSEYNSAWLATIIMTACSFVMTGCAVTGWILIGIGRMWTAFYFNLLWLIVFIICSLLLITPFALIGVSMTYLIAYSIGAIVSWTYLYINIGMNYKRSFQVIILFIISYIILIPIEILLSEILLYSIGTILLVSNILLLYRSLSKPELNNLIKIIKKILTKMTYKGLVGGQ